MDFIRAAEAGSNSDGAGFWQLAMVVLGIAILGLIGRWRKRRYRPPPTAREIRDRDRDPNRYRDAADRAIVEMLEMSRSLNAQVDTKIRLLNRLVKDAEEKTAALEKLLGLAGKTLEDGAVPGEAPPPAAKDASPPVSRRESAKRFVSDLQERIFLLHGQGRTAAEIAKTTNLSTIEVKFAIESMQSLSDPEAGAIGDADGS